MSVTKGSTGAGAPRPAPPRATGATPGGYSRVGGTRTLVVGIGECKVTDDPRRTLITYALGSCVGVTIWNRQARMAGLLHAMLPDSNLDPARARQSPFIFVDTGLARLIEEMKSRAASPRDLVVKVAGGASLIESSQQFQIGRNNVTAVGNCLRRHGLSLEASDTGGNGSRTMLLALMTGGVSLRRGAREIGVL
jgi:chemotaxis protein CheD